ncbi:MAG: EamA family transporter [Microbacteriaceae bacterium]|nr:EamA family transporter [Microbacteriaceae bacterium]
MLGRMTTTRPGSRLGAVAMLLCSATSLQFGAVLAVGLFPEMGSWAVNALRLAFAAAILHVLARPALHRWAARQWRAALLLGVAMGGMNGTFYAAIERIPLGTAVAIEFLGPLLLSAVLSRRARDLVWVGLAAAGMALIGIDSITGVALDPIGVLFALLAAGCWAAYIHTGATSGALIPGLGGLFVALVVGALMSLPLGLEGVALAAGDLRLLGLAALTAVLASLIPYSLDYLALRRLPRPVFGVLMSLEPVVATACGWLLLAQVPSALKLGAVALVVAASVGITLSGARGAPPHEARPGLRRRRTGSGGRTPGRRSSASRCGPSHRRGRG